MSKRTKPARLPGEFYPSPDLHWEKVERTTGVYSWLLVGPVIDALGLAVIVDVDLRDRSLPVGGSPIYYWSVASGSDGNALVLASGTHVVREAAKHNALQALIAVLDYTRAAVGNRAGQVDH